MARRKKNLLAAFALLAIMSIGSMGLGYTLWTDQISINGTVQTGNLDMIWIESGASAPTGNSASCVVNSGDTTDTLTVTLYNAYPGMVCTINSKIKQNGTAAGKVTSFSVTNDSRLSVDTCDEVGVGNNIGSTEACQTTVTVINDTVNNNASLPQGYNGGAISFSVQINFENYVP